MMEARTMTVLIAPKPAIMQKVAAAKVAAEKARQQAEREGRVLPPSEVSLPDVGDDDDDDDDDDDEGDETADAAEKAAEKTEKPEKAEKKAKDPKEAQTGG
jgi:translation initiation factor IF-3